MPGVRIEVVGAKRDENRILDLEGERFVLGRADDCAITLDAEVCSRQHALFELSGGSWFLRDLRSRNGTYLNGRLVESSALRVLDLVELGQAGARVRVVELDPEPGTGAAAAPLRPAPPREAGEEEGAPAAAPPVERSAPPPRAASAAPPATRKPPVRPPVAWTWAVPVLGLVFGAATVLRLWDHLGPGFPYGEVLAPVRWAMGGLAQLLPDLVGEASLWLERAIALVWFGGAGLALQRPLRRAYAAVTLAAGQIAAILLYT